MVYRIISHGYEREFSRGQVLTILSLPHACAVEKLIRALRVSAAVRQLDPDFENIATILSSTR